MPRLNCLFLSLLPLVAVAAPLAPVGGVNSTRTYTDLGKQIEVLAAAHAVEPGLRPLRLRWPDGRTFDVAEDDTAIVVTASIDEAERRFGLRRVELLMPKVGMWVVRGRPGEAGSDIAVRLADEVGEGRAFAQAGPNLWLERRTFGEKFVPDDPRFKSQWFFDDLKISEAWALEKGSADIGVAVLDTGCDSNHEDLREKQDPGRDVVTNDDDPSVTSNESGASHGTACAGLVAASTNNTKGVAGACPNCRLRCVRLLPIPSRALPISKDVSAFQFVVDSNVAVASNSWGYEDHVPVSAALKTAIEKAFDEGRGGKGAVIVFAAGNEDREVLDDEMLAIRGVLGVGAITHYQELTSYSNRGASVDLVAPVGTVTTDLSGAAGDDEGDYMSSFGGTSSACPIVAGIAGLVASASPESSAAEIEDILMQTTTPAAYALPDGNGHDLMYGFGVVNPLRAVRVAKGLPADPEPEVVDAGTPDAGKPSDGSGGDSGGNVCGTGGVGFAFVGLLGAWVRRRERR